MTIPNISVFKDKTALAHAAAEAFVETANLAIDARGRFSVVLAGGGTPKQMHELLASEEFKAQIDWSKVNIFFGDERFVPHDHEQSNYRQATDCLIQHLADTNVTVYAIPTEALSAEEAQKAYETTLMDYFDSDMTSFDLVYLGIGPDGHTASLFPKHPLLQNQNNELVQVLHDSPKPPSTRLTLSYKSVNAARDIIILAAGKNKREAMEGVLDQSVQISDLPVKGILPNNGQHRWFVDVDLMGADLLEKVKQA